MDRWTVGNPLNQHLNHLMTTKLFTGSTVDENVQCIMDLGNSFTKKILNKHKHLVNRLVVSLLISDKP